REIMIFIPILKNKHDDKAQYLERPKPVCFRCFVKPHLSAKNGNRSSSKSRADRNADGVGCRPIHRCRYLRAGNSFSGSTGRAYKGSIYHGTDCVDFILSIKKLQYKSHEAYYISIGREPAFWN